MAAAKLKDYSLKGGSAGAAEITDDSLEDRVGAQWFSCKVDRKRLKRLMRRTDADGLRHFGIWLGVLAVSGVAAVLAWGTLWCVPALAVYGTFYAAADHRGHELSHGTPFRTRWLNEVLYHLCAFMTLREAYYYRWSHSRHHTHTIIVGRDPEIAAPRPPDVLGMVLDLFFLKDGARMIGKILRNATGSLVDQDRHFIPESEKAKVVRSSRAYVAIFVGTIGACVALGSLLPAMLIVLPRFYAGPLAQIFNITQHAGLDEDVYDHRLNTRTVLMNPVFGFLYCNMNHHMFPMVPFYALPQLHDMIKDQCPPAYPSLWAAYKEIVPALLRQRKDPTYFIRRELPGAPQPALRAA